MRRQLAIGPDHAVIYDAVERGGWERCTERVLLDASVLSPNVLRDTLLTLAEHDVHGRPNDLIDAVTGAPRTQ